MYRKNWLHGLVGRPGRFDVAAWVVRSAGDGYFTQRDAVLGVGDNQGEVRAALEALADLGLIEKASAAGRPHYRRISSPVWTALRQLADAVDQLVAGTANPAVEPDPPRATSADEATIQVHLPARRVGP